MPLTEPATSLRAEATLDLFRRWRPVFERASELKSSRGVSFGSAEAARSYFAEDFRRIENEVVRAGNPRWIELNRDASYAVAALIDETARVFLSPEGQRYWHGRELIQEFFPGSMAGTEFYQRADKLLKRAQPDEGEVRAVYFRALALGFRGQFTGEDSFRALDKAKALLRSIDPDVGRLRLTEAAYEHVHRGKDPRIHSRRATAALILLLGVIVAGVLYFRWTMKADFSAIAKSLDEIAKESR
jgi:type IV/VI secretion system ImpK/VasF family protein